MLHLLRFGFLMALCSCASRPTNIAVTLPELSPEINSVEIRASLDGKSATSPIRSPKIQRFFVDLNPNSAGLLQLDAAGFSIDSCLIARGATSAQVDPAIPIELSLPLPLLSQPACSVVVSITTPAGGRVISDPPGIDCGAICSAHFPPDTVVSFSFESSSSAYYFGGWSGDCLGSKDCQIRITNDGSVLNANVLPVVDWWSAAGSSEQDVWVVGARGSIIHWNGSYWSSVPSNTVSNLHAVWANSANDADAAGENGTILHWDGTRWQVTSVGTASLRGLWGNDVAKWAVGTSGSIFTNRGGSWSTVTSGTSNDLNAIWGSGPNDIWSAGNSGVLLHFDGTLWTKVNSNTANHLRSIWGSGSSNVWIVGSAGTALHYDGLAISPHGTNTAQDLNAIWDSWAAGTGGTVLRYNGSTWEPYPALTSMAFQTIWGSSQLQVWFIGVAGTVLQLQAGAIG